MSVEMGSFMASPMPAQQYFFPRRGRAVRAAAPNVENACTLYVHAVARFDSCARRLRVGLG